MDPTLAWFLMIALHAGGVGCCNSQTEVVVPPVECKVAAGKDTCTVSAYEICRAFAAANKDATLYALRCVAEPTK